MKNSSDILIIGGGVAGLMAGIELVKNGKSVILLEKESVVGGQCKTEVLSNADDEFRFDYGGHRFITNNEELLEFVEKMLAQDLLVSQRSSVILHQNKVYEYPLNLKNLLKVAPKVSAESSIIIIPFFFKVGAIFSQLTILPIR